MDRRVFLATSTAAMAAAALKTAYAETEGPFGETGVPLKGTDRLPLGPLPNSRYPDRPHRIARQALRGQRRHGRRRTDRHRLPLG